LTQIPDLNQREYLKNFMVPVGTKMLSDRLKIRSTGKIPALGNYLDYCDDQGELTPDPKYRNNETDADFLLILGGFSQSTNIIAYATFCLIGTDSTFYLINFK